MDFSNLDLLAKFLEEKIDKSLKRETAQVVVKTMQQHIKSDVYPLYSPDMYQREYYRGGLLDPDNIEIQVTNTGISVENVRDNTTDEDYNGHYRNVAEIVETGENYNWTASRIYKDPFPRPFTENTREELRTSNILEQAMKDGLNRQGIDARLK